MCDQLTALAEAAAAAKSEPDMDGIAALLEEALCSAVETECMRQVQAGSNQRRLPWHLRQELGIRQLRRAKRQSGKAGDAT